MNKHLIKIILEYIEYELPFIKELLNKTRDILTDTSYYWNYNNHYKSMNSNITMNHQYKILCQGNIWQIKFIK